MEQQPNINEQILKKLEENNLRLRGIYNMLVGILITTGIVALIFIIVYSKISNMGGGGF